MRKNSTRLKSLSDVRRFLSRVANELDRNEIDQGKARTLTYIASILAQVVKDSDLEARIEELEKQAEGNQCH